MSIRLRVVLCMIILILVGNAYAGVTSRSLVGNWSGVFEGDTLEIAVWFDRKATELPMVRGYIFNDTKNCGAGIAGVRSASVATTFFGWVGNPTLTDYTLEFEIGNLTPAPIEMCAPMGTHGRLMLDHQTSSNTYRILGMDNPPQTNNMTNMKVLMDVRRQPASSQMQSLIASNPKVSREQGPGRPPGIGAAKLISDASLDPESTVTVKEMPCMVHQRDQQVRMNRMGIRSVAASLDSARVLGVRYEQFNAPIPNGVWSDEFRASKQERYVQIPVGVIAESEFLEMPPGKQKRFGPTSCKQSIAVEQFLTMLEAGEIGDSVAATDIARELPRIENPRGLYFFDRDGIDRIDGDNMVRVFGTTTIFVPGDLSREGTWTASTQSMKLRAMVKTTESDLIEKDLLSFPNEARFAYDEDLSKRYGGDIWVTVADSRDGGICLRWRDKHFNDNCIERSTAEMYKQHRYYMAKDLLAAKRIFGDISPDAITLGAADLADPTRGCDDGIFCDLPGGLYLNAIYEADFSRIRALNELLAKNARANQPRMFPDMQNSDFDLEGAMFEMISMPSSFTADLADRYMYQYQKAPVSCLDPGHKVVPKEEFVPATYAPQPDINNIPQPDMKTSDAYWLRSSYTINPPFFGLCDRLCTAGGPNTFSGSRTKQYGVISQSIDRVLFENDCRSEKIKRFEKNLIAMTIKELSSEPRQRYAQRSSL